MEKTAVVSPKAPKFVDAHYSQGLQVSGADLLFVTGMTPRDPNVPDAQGRPDIVHKGDIGQQGRLVFEHLRNVLAAAGLGPSDVVQLRIYYKDVSCVAPVVQIRDAFFTEEPYPAVTGLVCDLTDPEILVEIDAVAAVPREAMA